MLSPVLLPLLVFVPLALLPALWLIPNRQAALHKWVAGAGVAAQAVLAVMLFFSMQQPTTAPALSFVSNWFSFQIFQGHLFQAYLAFSVDGLNAVFVLLSAIVMLLGWLASFMQTKRTKAYFSLYLLLCTTVFGSFLAADFILFYVFFEFMLLPMFFLIGIWGGYRREYASLKFFIYTLVGSLFILMSGLALNISTQQVVDGQVVHSFLFDVLQNTSLIPQSSSLHPDSTAAFLSIPIRQWGFILMLVGFLIKLPAVPFHTWLPDAHVEASNAISVVLAGVLLKIGGYGLIRLAFGFYPDVAMGYGWFIGLTGVVGIVYGALNALGMGDLKKMVAYSSVSHMGFVLVGLAAFNHEGFNGAVFQMFSHGLSSALLFLLVAVLYDRTFDRQINHYRGLAGRMPFFTAFVVIGFFASMGMPGFSGFIGEFLVVSAALKSALLQPNVGLSLDMWMPLGALFGIALNAAYFLWAFRRMFFGLFWCKGGQTTEHKLTDLTPREWVSLIIPAVLLVVFGLLPHLVIDVTEGFANSFLLLFGN